MQKRLIYGIILMRVKGQDPLEKIALLKKLLEKYPDKIISHFVVITKEKFRFIPQEVR